MAWCAVRRTRYAGLQRGARVGVVIVLVLRTGVGMWSAYGWKGVVVALLERGAGLLLKPLQEQLAERLAPCCLRHVEVRCVRGGLALHPWSSPTPIIDQLLNDQNQVVCLLGLHKFTCSISVRMLMRDVLWLFNATASLYQDSAVVWRNPS